MVTNKQNHRYHASRKYLDIQNCNKKNTVIKQQPHQVKNPVEKQNDLRKHHFSTTKIIKMRCSNLKTKENGQKRLALAKHRPQPNPHQTSPTPLSSQ